MATMEAAEAPSIPEPIPKRSDATKFVRNWAYLRMAHEGLMLEKMQRQNRIVENLAKSAADGTVGKEQQASAGEEDMGVSIGNEYHYHMQPAPLPPTAPTSAVKPEPLDYDKMAAAVAGKIPIVTPPPAVAQPGDQPMGTGTKAAIAAALLAAGVAGGAGLGWALSGPTAKDTDTDTSVSISIPEEDRTK